MIIKHFGADIEFFFQAWSLFCMKYDINFCLEKYHTSYWVLETLCPFIEII